MALDSHDLARKFFDALSAGNLPDDLLTEDMQAWTVSSGSSDKSTYQGGVKLLGAAFPQGITYTVQSLTAEEDRVAAEVVSEGTLVNGQPFRNDYLFLLRIRDGRIASVREFFNPKPVQELLAPVLQEMMAKGAR